MSVDDLAAYLVLPKQTIYRWQQTGTGPTPFRVGRYLRWAREDVDRWLREQKVAVR